MTESTESSLVKVVGRIGRAVRILLGLTGVLAGLAGVIFAWTHWKEDIVKFILLGLLLLPFVALVTDVLGKTRGMMPKVAAGVAGVSVLLAWLVGGLHQRPNVANLFIGAFLAWPFLLLIAKALNASLPWRSIWISVPITSWYLVNVSMQFYYPTDGGGGGFGAGVGLVTGWLYMALVFGPLCLIFIGLRWLVRRIRGGQAGAAIKH